MTVIDDDEVLDLLQRALGLSDPVPNHVLEASCSAFTWRTIDAELAELVFDSTYERIGVRTDESNRQVTFSSPAVQIELTVIDNGSRRLVGQLVPAAVATIELVERGAVHSTRTDEHGRFSFADVAAGPLRLVVLDDQGARTVQTEILL